MKSNILYFLAGVIGFLGALAPYIPDLYFYNKRSLRSELSQFQKLDDKGELKNKRYSYFKLNSCHSGATYKEHHYADHKDHKPGLREKMDMNLYLSDYCQADGSYMAILHHRDLNEYEVLVVPPAGGEVITLLDPLTKKTFWGKVVKL